MPKQAEFLRQLFIDHSKEHSDMLARLWNVIRPQEEMIRHIKEFIAEGQDLLSKIEKIKETK